MKKLTRNKSTREIKKIVRQYIEGDISAEDVVDMLPQDNDIDKFIDMLIEEPDYMDMLDEEEEVLDETF